MRIFLFLIASIILLFSCDSSSTDTKKDVSDIEEVSDEHNAENNLDYLGSYEGMFPCDDCEGITVTINLNEDKTYLQSTAFIGNEQNDFEMNGTWTIDKSKITLTDSLGKKENYFVGENFIQQMDEDGNRMEGETKDEFVLRKKQVNESI